MRPDSDAVRSYLLGLQDSLCAALESEDGAGRFADDSWQRTEGGGGRSRVLAEGKVFEKAAVLFSHVTGSSLPQAASVRRPDMAGKAWSALGVSLIVHPRNPFVPTSHANVRFFVAGTDTPDPVWWFGGGWDLTPCYGFEEDAVHWHRAAKRALDPFGGKLHERMKKACDEYFFLKHRNEARGIGGLFFEDFDELGFERSFALMRGVGDAYLAAYRPIVAKRKATPFGDAERMHQLRRRGRYVEFNLLQDRGTLFGLQSGGRTESILVSLPPLARWDYGAAPRPGSPEARLVEHFLRPRDWLSEHP